jgi:HK97 family phage prohead protease
MQHRGYSLLDIKSVSEELRVIEGWATTPKVDRVGDVVEPLGITAAPTIPLLLHHDSRLPVGIVTLGKPTKKGVPFTARLPHVAEPGALQDRVNEAWQMVKYRLIAATSIGFRVIGDAVERIDTGLRFLKTEVMELSLVAIPAQDEAVITAFKSYCDGEAGDEALAAIKALDGIRRETFGTYTVTFDAEPAYRGATSIEIQAKPTDEAASGRKVHVAKLNAPARDRAPFVIKRVNHLR